MASASVDLETDSKIQHTIKTEFQDRTLLCIGRAYYFRGFVATDHIDRLTVCRFQTGYVPSFRTTGCSSWMPEKLL